LIFLLFQGAVPAVYHIVFEDMDVTVLT